MKVVIIVVNESLTMLSKLTTFSASEKIYFKICQVLVIYGLSLGFSYFLALIIYREFNLSSGTCSILVWPFPNHGKICIRYK